MGSGAGVRQERACGCAPRGPLPRPLSAGLHPQSPARASHSEFPILQPGFRKETNPLCAPWCRFAPLWGSQVWGKSRALDGRILTGEGVGASRGTRLPRRGKEASWWIHPGESAESLVKKTVNSFLLGQIER